MLTSECVYNDDIVVLSCECFRPHLLQRMAVLYSLTFKDRLLKEPLKGYPVSF